jgi:hypothetical protein
MSAPVLFRPRSKGSQHRCDPIRAYPVGMVSISVAVDDEHLARIGDVVADLRANGMQVDQVLDRLGVISGSVPEDRQQSLQAVAGVKSVEASHHFQIPPPDASVQ